MVSSSGLEYITAKVAAEPEQYYMGARPYTQKNLDKLPWHTGVLVQDKLDGVYLRLHVTPEGTKGFLRSGREVDLTKLNGLSNNIKELRSSKFPYFVEGELVSLAEDHYFPREVTAGYINSITKGKDPIPDVVEFQLFTWFIGHPGDTIAQVISRAHKWDYFGSCSHVVRVRSHLVYSQTLAEKLAEDAVSRGKEEGNSFRDGVVCKAPNQIWTPGKPAGCVKIKPWQTMHMEVVGVTKHTKNPDMIGALMCAWYRDSSMAINVNVGSGLTNEDRLKDPSYYLNKEVIVEYEDLTEPNKKGIRSLSLPRFKGVV